MYLYIHAFASEPSFTGFRGVLRDANMPVPDAQHPPVDPDIDRGDPCPEDEEFFDRPDAATMEEAISRFMDGRSVVASMTCTDCLGACQCQLLSQVKQWHSNTRWKAFSPVNDRGGAEAIYTIRTSLVQACPGIQVQTGLITVHTKYILMFTGT